MTFTFSASPGTGAIARRTLGTRRRHCRAAGIRWQNSPLHHQTGADVREIFVEQNHPAVPPGRRDALARRVQPALAQSRRMTRRHTSARHG
jgi:hypothetical protein